MKIEVWSRNNQKSKENFNITLKSLKSKGINISHSELNIDELDPYGQNLYIDVAWIGNPQAEKLYMSTSGIHGVEGFAGSAIQLSVLNNLNKIPDYFIRKQTLTNAERFFTEELKEYENKILTAQENIIRIFLSLRQFLRCREL